MVSARVFTTSFTDASRNSLVSISLSSTRPSGKSFSISSHSSSISRFIMRALLPAVCATMAVVPLWPLTALA